MPVFKKNESWWIDYYYIGRRYRQKIGSRKKDAEEAFSQVKVQIAAGTFVPQSERSQQAEAPEVLTFQAFAADEFLPWSQAQHADKHHTRLSSIIRAHLNPVFGHRPLHELTTKLIEDYMVKRRRSRYKRGKKSYPTSEATINRELCCIKVILKKAVEWDYLESSCARGIKTYKERPASPQLLEVQEVARLLEETSSRFKALVACAVYAGLRREELFYLQWTDIHWSRGELIVSSRREHHTKNYQSRRIPMNEALTRILRTHKTNHIVVGSPYVFANLEGKPYKNVRRPLDKAAQNAGIADTVKLHQLRHAFCSHALMSGIDPRTVQKWMGHKDLKTTLGYAHVSPDHEKAAIEQLRYITTKKGAGIDRIRETAKA
jgi:site-specific recombinase XerD